MAIARAIERNGVHIVAIGPFFEDGPQGQGALNRYSFYP